MLWQCNCSPTIFGYTFSHAAAAILDTAQEVLKALEGSKEAQDKAQQAITQADDDIRDARLDLTQVAHS